MFTFKTDNKNYNFSFNRKDDKIVGVTIDSCYLFTVEFLDDYLAGSQQLSPLHFPDELFVYINKILKNLAFA